MEHLPPLGDGIFYTDRSLYIESWASGIFRSRGRESCSPMRLDATAHEKQVAFLGRNEISGGALTWRTVGGRTVCVRTSSIHSLHDIQVQCCGAKSDSVVGQLGGARKSRTGDFQGGRRYFGTPSVPYRISKAGVTRPSGSNQDWLEQRKRMCMLPSFPKAQRILDEEWNKRMFAVKSEVFPIHLHPPVQPIIEGKDGDFQREDGQVRPLNIERHQVTAQYQFKDGRGLSLEDFYEKAKEVGEGFGKQMWQMLIDTVGEAVEEAGNEVKVKKGDLKKEDILRMLEMGVENFDEAGNPTRQLICGSDLGEDLKKLEAEWRNDKEFLAKVAAIEKRKKAEFDEREARRRLVD